MFKGTLQRKILVMVITLISIIMALMLSLFIYIDYVRTFDRTKENSLQTAKLISHMDVVQSAISAPNASEELKPIIDHYESQVRASFIVIKDKNGQVLTYPQEEKIGEIMPFEDEFIAIVFGGYYSGVSVEVLGPSVVGIAPIFNREGQLSGTVKVGFLVEGLSASIVERAKKLFNISLFILLLGIFASIWLARSIRKDTLGLEPQQITSLYSERKAILASISEGIIAIDAEEKITLMNSAAKEILDLAHSYIGEPIQSVLPSFVLHDQHQYMSNEIRSSFELNMKDKILIMTTVPLRDGISRKGAVITFKDRTEMVDVVNRLFEVSEYSNNLRAQTHEFTNKLYAISGFLQLGNYDQAIRMIQEEIEVNEYTNRLVFEHIKDPNVQAIILGKMGVASEMKIAFMLDENSSLQELPSFIRIGELTVIMGNLLDNAFEAVSTRSKGEVVFFALDIGKDIIIEVSDNGPGIPEALLDEIFKQGVTTKQKSNHGFGLVNVHKIVQSLGGDIQVTSNETGTTFSVYIPKKEKVEGDFE